nr:MAG: major capsid protein [Microvirus sp.]
MQSHQSNMVHDFSQVPAVDIQRSKFDRSSNYKTTFDVGLLVPFYDDEVLPGDTFNVHATLFGRLATPLTPFMDNLFLDTFYFFVPARLTWDNWQKFNGEQINPGDSTSYLVPKLDKTKAPLNTTGFAASTIYDYVGLPTLITNIEPNSLLFRAYNLIYNEWFRDENMQNSLTVPLGDGPDDPALYTLQRRGKRHDYFTSCLPWPQKGPSVKLPLQGFAPVLQGANPSWLQSTSLTVPAGAPSAAGAVAYTASGFTVNGVAASIYPRNLYADLSLITAATINDLRLSVQIQKIYELDARGGTRYTEILKAHFGVTSPDGRLQRPEYLGGGTTRINVNPIAQTSAVPSQPTPLGNLAAMGTVSSSSGFTKSFTEHGYIIGLVSVRADLSYQQGLERKWTRRTRFDFYWPEFANLGEQAVLNKEIYCKGIAADEDVFGYQERAAEYRYKQSLITGQFRSNFPQTLDSWHLAQNFTALPTLNSTFIVENPPIDRVLAVPTYPDMLLDVYIKNITARPMPMYSVPGLTRF